MQMKVQIYGAKKSTALPFPPNSTLHTQTPMRAHSEERVNDVGGRSCKERERSESEEVIGGEVRVNE